MSNIDKKMGEEKDQLANYVFVIFVILLTLVLAASVYRVKDIGWHPIIPLEIGSLILAYFLAYFRKSIPLNIKAFLLIITPYTIAVIGVTVFGIVGSNSFLWIFTPIIATALFNLRVGIILVIISALIIFGFGTLTSMGLWKFNFDANTYIYSFSSWALQTTTYVCFAGISVLIAGKMNDIIQNNLKLVEKQKEELAAANATKDKLFSVIAHDLRSPLHGMISLMEVLSREDIIISEEERYVMTTKMLKDSQSTYSMLENLLTWSRSQIGALNIAKNELVVDYLINESINPYRSNADNKNIKINVDLKEGLTCYADEASLRIVISNLVNNAIKFTPAGGQIIVSGIKDRDRAIIKVKDTGIGISQEAMEKLFDDKDHTTTLGTDDEKGTGLGLGICYDLVKKNDGEIWVESKIGEGATFIISLVTNNVK